MGTDRQRNLEVVEQFFSGPRDLDRLSLMSDDCEWFNGIGKFPAAPGQTTFVGKDEIGRRRARARRRRPPPLSGRKVDRYDLTTARFHDVHTIADGPYVFRQHGYTATTIGGPRLRQRVRLPLPLRRRRPDRPRVGALGHARRLRAAVPVRPRGARPRRAAHDDAVGAAAPRSRTAGRTRRHRAVPRRRGARTERLEHPAVPVRVHRRPRAQARHRRALPRPRCRSSSTDRAPTAPEDNVDRTTERQQRIARSVFHLRDHLHEVPVLCVPIVAGRTDGLGVGRAGRTHVGVLAGEPLGLGDPDAVVVHARAAFPRPGLGVDHAHPVPRARDGRAARRAVRRVDAGRAVPDRVHAGHRLRGHAARTGGESCAGTTSPADDSSSSNRFPASNRSPTGRGDPRGAGG